MHRKLSRPDKNAENPLPEGHSGTPDSGVHTRDLKESVRAGVVGSSTRVENKFDRKERDTKGQQRRVEEDMETRFQGHR